MIPSIIVAVGGIWLLNILGESILFNALEIIYSTHDPKTGQITFTQGCRAERLMPDGTCDTSITFETLRRSFPFLSGPNEPSQK